MAARSGVSVTSTLHQARQADGCQVGSQCKNCLAVSSSIRKLAAAHALGLDLFYRQV
jgi:hypothetical protein